MTVVSSLVVEIGSDISGLSRGITNADREISGFVTSTGRNLTRLGAGMTAGISAPLLGIGAAGVKLASDFESTMTEISARTGVVGDDLQSLSDYALQMGADTSFSGQQAADAMLQLLTSGQNAEQAMSTLPLVLDAAAASGEDLGRTADVLTDIMASFGLPIDAMTPKLQAAATEFGVSEQMIEDWGNNVFETTPQLDAMAMSLDLTNEELADLIWGTEDAADVVNALAQAAGASSADMASLGQGFANVGGVARNFGLSVEDTAAILAIFSENGTKGAEAGDQLKSMLLNMTRSTEDVEAAWDSLGTSLYDTEGNLRDFETVMGELDTALDSLPIEEQNELMHTLAGSHGILGLTALRGSISIDEMRDSMRDQATAAEVADARMDTFAGRMDSLQGSVETLMITALTPLMEDVLSPLAEDLTGLTNKVIDWAEENPELTNTIVAIGGALALLGPALVGIGGAMMLAAPAVAALGVAFGVLVSPIGLAVAAVAGLAIAYNENLGGIKDYVEGTILPALNNIDLSGFSTGLQTGISDAISGVTVAGESVDLTGLQTGIADSFANLDFSGIQPTIDTHFNDILGTIVSVAGMVFGGPVGMAIGAASLVGRAIESDFLGIGTFINESGISTAVNDALSSVQTTINDIIGSVFGGAQQGPQEAPALDFQNILPQDGTGLSGPLGLFVSDLQRGFTALQDIADNVVANIMPGLTDLGEGVKGFIDNLAGTETDGLLRVVTAIVGFVGGIAAKGVELGSAALGRLLSEVADVLPELGSFINDFISSISNMGEGDWGGALTNLADSLIDIGQAAVNFFGIDLQIPDFSTVLAGWQTFADSVGIIINHAFNSVAVGFRTLGRDIEELISRAQVAGADVNNFLGRGSAENDAARNAGIANIQGIESAEALEQQIRDSLAAGDLSIDMSQFMVTDPVALAAKIVDPVLIQQALNTALGEGDQAMFDVLAPVAMALGIDPQTITDQYQAAIDAAAAGTTFSAQVTADITVNAGRIDFSNIAGSMTGVQTAANMGAAVAVPGLDTGGYIKQEGLTYLHNDELVLNPAQTQDYMSGRAAGGAPGTPTVINIYAQTVDQMIAELNRRGLKLVSA